MESISRSVVSPTLAACVVAVSMASAGCGAGTESEPTLESRLVGIWKWEEPGSVPPPHDAYLVLHADGTGAFRERGVDDPLRWEVEEGYGDPVLRFSPDDSPERAEDLELRGVTNSRIRAYWVNVDEEWVLRRVSEEDVELPRVSEGGVEDDHRAQSNTHAQSIHMAMMIAGQAEERGPGGDRPLPDDIAELYHQNLLSIESALSPFTDTSLPRDFEQWSESRKSSWLRTNASYIIVPDLVESLNPEEIAVFLRPEHSDGSGISVTYNDNNTVWERDIDSIDQKLQEQTGASMRELFDRRMGVRPVDPQ